MKRHVLPILLVIFASFWTIRPLFVRGYFTMHDDTQVGRVIVMGKALRNGQFPVRWVSDLGYGYGYPLYNFYGPLPYYFGGGLYAAGVDAVTATKIMMGVGMMLSVLFMYGFVHYLWGRLTGLLAGVLYIYAPYHAVQLYVRGAVGELWAYGFLPLLFLGLLYRDKKSGVWIGGLVFAAIILSHTITGYVTSVFYIVGLVLYSLVLFWRRRFYFSLLTSHFSLLFIGLGLSAFFWLPAIAEMRYTNVVGQIGATANFRDHFVCFPQLWNSLWGYGGSTSGCIDGMSFKIGKLHVALGVLGLLLGGWRQTLIVSISTVSLFLVLPESQRLWEIIPGFAYVQYPWRFLTSIAFTLSILGASLARNAPRFLRFVIAAAMILAVIALNAKLFVPQMTHEKPSDFFESEEELKWRVSKVSDEYLPPTFVKPKTSSEVARDILDAETEIDTETYAKLHVLSAAPRDVTLRRAYFPGWQYWVNGVRQEPRVNGGLPTIGVPAGGSVVELRFGSTPVRVAGNILSLLVILWFLRTYGKKTIA